MRRVFFLFVLSLSALSAQVTYNATSDRNIRPLPPLPGMGPAGSVIQDPTYGTPILRLTDNVSTTPGNRTASYYTPSASYANPWNTNSTLLVIESHLGSIPFRFDPASFQATRIGDAPLELTEAWFSYKNPNIVFGMRGRSIVQYDFSNNSYTQLLDLNSVTSFDQYASSLSVGGDDRMFVVGFGGQQNTHPYIVVWDRQTGNHQLVNLRARTLNGRPANIPGDVSGVHSVVLDRSGRYVAINNGAVVWDLQNGSFTRITANNSGHEVFGFGTRINHSGYEASGISDSMGLTLRPLDSGGCNSNLKQLIDPAPDRPYLWGEGGHWSWNNLKASGPTAPVFGSFFREGWARGNPWKTWNGEIVAVRTDGQEARVWRFAHHRSHYQEFWDSPRGNISQDGRFFMFTSNWERTLGNDKSGKPRQDVFILKLPLAGAQAAEPPRQQPTPPAVQNPAPGNPAPNNPAPSMPDWLNRPPGYYEKPAPSIPDEIYIEPPASPAQQPAPASTPAPAPAPAEPPAASYEPPAYEPPAYEPPAYEQPSAPEPPANPYGDLPASPWEDWLP